MKIKQINNVKVKPIKFDKNNDLPVKAENMIKNAYGNLFLCAKKRSGKTTVLYNIVKKCINKLTRVFIFCSTCNRDQSYKKLMDMLDSKKVEYEVFTSIIEGGSNKLAEIMEDLNNVSSDESESEEEEEQPKREMIFKLNCEEEDGVKKRKYKYKSKFLCPKYIFIFDDLSTQLRDKNVESLLKKNRHYKSRVIISSQYLNDISPASRMQLDYIMIFKGLPIEKLQQIHRDVDISTDFDKFVDMYGYATQDQFNFLYVDIRTEEYRRNFNTQLIPDE